MTSFNTLPSEIRQLILQHIDSTKQLGECRRISKIWDEPAECAMFSRQLCITPENIRSLYVHLLTKPSLAKCIKDIHFDSRGFTEFMASFLRLAITPNIERVTSGSLYDLDIRFYQTMNQMVRDSGIRLKRLKSIPWPRQFTDTHYQTAHLLKDSLEEFTIPPTHLGRRHEILTQLGECKYLSKLQFNFCSFDTLPRMESIFGNNASHLMEVNLQGCGFDEGNAWTQEERFRWMRQHGKINENAIALEVVDERNLSFPLIEYFLVKYPNMRQFDYQTSTDIRNLTGVDYNVEISRQACSWIRRIPKYTMVLNSRHEWRTHYESFAGGKNTFHLHYGQRPINQRSHVSSIVEQDGERTTHFKFWVRDISYHFFDTHVTFLQEIGGFTTGLHLHFADQHASKSTVFFRALEVMNRLEDMRFSSPGSLHSVELDLPSQYSERRLNTLEINDATLQPKVFNTLDRLFDTISTLKLSSFPIVDTSRQVKVSRYLIQKDDTDTFCIHMPSTTIGKLILNTESEATSLSYYDPYRLSISKDKFILATEAYLMINLQHKIPLYLKLRPFRNDAQQISLQEYSNRPEFAHTLPEFVHAFKIDCLMLASIELHLGDIHATIDVQKYYDQLNMASD